MTKYPFLSDEWLAQARAVYSEADAEGAFNREPPPVTVRVNLVVNQSPFSGAPIDAHVDTSTGRLSVDKGHLPEPDVTVSLDYDTARSLFVTGDVQAAMQAFLMGRIKVDGDLTKLLDPRSGLFPAGGMATGSGAGAPAAARPPAPSATEEPGQASLGSVADARLDIAARLQAITE